MRTPADVVTATSQAYRKDAYVVALDKRATGAAIHVATQGAHDAGFARVTFVGAAAPSPAAELVADKPVLRAVLVPPTATRDVRAGCDDDDALAHLAKSAGGPGIELATARVPPITLPSGRLCIVIGPSDTGDGLASALENLAAQHVDVAIGAAPAARNDDDDALGYGHTHARLTDEERRIARLSDDFDAPQRTREAIRAFVVSRSHDVRACYERGLARNPKVAGTLKVAFVIERDGHVDDVTVVDDGVHDQDIVACIVARIGTWKGMRPSDEPTHVSYPFVLKAAE